jgi:hypothetical protein
MWPWLTFKTHVDQLQESTSRVEEFRSFGQTEAFCNRGGTASGGVQAKDSTPQSRQEAAALRNFDLAMTVEGQIRQCRRLGWLSFAFRLLGGRCPSDQTPDSQTSETVLDVIFIRSISPAPVLCLFLIF